MASVVLRQATHSPLTETRVQNGEQPAYADARQKEAIRVKRVHADQALAHVQEALWR